MLACHTIIALTLEGELQEVHVDDVKMEGIRQHLEETITKKIVPWWVYGGNGVWKRTQAAADQGTKEPSKPGPLTQGAARI